MIVTITSTTKWKTSASLCIFIGLFSCCLALGSTMTELAPRDIGADTRLVRVAALASAYVCARSRASSRTRMTRCSTQRCGPRSHRRRRSRGFPDRLGLARSFATDLDRPLDYTEPASPNSTPWYRRIGPGQVPGYDGHAEQIVTNLATGALRGQEGADDERPFERSRAAVGVSLGLVDRRHGPEEAPHGNPSIPSDAESSLRLASAERTLMSKRAKRGHTRAPRADDLAGAAQLSDVPSKCHQDQGAARHNRPFLA